MYVVFYHADEFVLINSHQHNHKIIIFMFSLVLIDHFKLENGFKMSSFKAVNSSVFSPEKANTIAPHLITSVQTLVSSDVTKAR